MQFTLIASYPNAPTVFYDGEERLQFPLTIPLDGRSEVVQIDPLAPECRQWRHYFKDEELNELANLLDLKFEFMMNQETVVAPTSGKRVYFQPIWCRGSELTICYTYDEVSNGHYVFWLLAVLSRNILESEFGNRINNIKAYWLK